MTTYRKTLTVLVVAALVLVPQIPSVSAAPAAPAAKPAAVSDPKVQRTLQALDKLHSYGYTIDTPEHADRAIRHWQKVNGLVVDGVVGSQTASSLNLGTPVASVSSPATAGAPAVRPNPPAPQATPSPVPVGDGDIEAIVRDVWPADLVGWVLKIIARESNFVPTARNSCCWGLMQLNWTAHRGWLAGFGITDPHQLLDARTNIEMAYQLYLIDGKTPWTCC